MYQHPSLVFGQLFCSKKLVIILRNCRVNPSSESLSEFAPDHSIFTNYNIISEKLFINCDLSTMVLRTSNTFCCSALLLMFNDMIFSLKLLNYYDHLCKSPIFQMMLWHSFYYMVIKTYLMNWTEIYSNWLYGSFTKLVALTKILQTPVMYKATTTSVRVNFSSDL